VTAIVISMRQFEMSSCGSRLKKKAITAAVKVIDYLWLPNPVKCCSQNDGLDCLA